MKHQRARFSSLVAFGLFSLGASRCSGDADTSNSEDGDAGAPSSSGGAGPAGSGNSEAGAPEAGSAGSAQGGMSGANATGGVGGSTSGGSAGDGGESTETGGTNPGGSAGSGTAGSGAAGRGGSGGVAGRGGAGSGGAAGSSAGAGGSGGAGGMAGACPTMGGEMRRIPPGYCIDRTEVTVGAYRAWIATNPIASPATQVARCASNLNFPPNPVCAESREYHDIDEYPQTCIDWCDAHAFCQAMGKRLCGRIGGGETPYESFTDPAVSQWHNACTSGGMTSYSYSGEPGEMSCVDQEFVRLRGIVGPLWVSPPDTPGCQSSIPGYEGVIDLSGNVMEWEDSCVEVGGGRHRCRMRGGSYLATDIRCATIDDEFMDDLHTSMGFRCCAY